LALAEKKDWSSRLHPAVARGANRYELQPADVVVAAPGLRGRDEKAAPAAPFAERTHTPAIRPCPTVIRINKLAAALRYMQQVVRHHLKPSANLVADLVNVGHASSPSINQQ
jgi:hypothetical protein